jgi:DNA-binding GntR family transcriptional regulator
MPRKSTQDKAASRPVGRPRGTGADRIYGDLRNRILSLDLLPGTELEGSQIAAEYEVSRTLIREAFIRLAADGLIQLFPNRSARVSFLEMSEIPDLLEVLELFGRATTRWAAVRCTDEDIEKMEAHRQGWRDAALQRNYGSMAEENNDFHEAIAAAAGNRYILRIYQNLLSRYRRLSYTLYAGLIGTEDEYRRYHRRVDGEHQRMVDAVAERDTDKADLIAKMHAHQIVEQIGNYLGRKLADDFPIYDPGRSDRADRKQAGEGGGPNRR